MNSVELTALLLLTTGASFTPGPNTTLSTALGANFGLRRALRFVLAVPVGWGLLFSLCAGGVGAPGGGAAAVAYRHSDAGRGLSAVAGVQDFSLWQQPGTG